MRRIQAILCSATFACCISPAFAEVEDESKTAEERAEALQDELDEERAERDRASAAPTKRAAIEEITVTAQKREQKLFDVPMSISAFSGEALEEMGAENLMDIATATPGFSVGDDGPGVQTIQIRGIASSVGKSTAGYQFDNVPLTSAPSSQPDVPSYDLAAIEILRGPQGTLYGEGSMGGTVKLLSNKPDFEGWEGTAQTGFSVTKDGSPSNDFKTALNIPISDNQAARMVLVRTEIGGFIDQTEFGIDDHNRATKVNGRIKYLFEASDFFTTSAMIMAFKTDAGSTNAADPNYERRDKADVGIDDEGQVYNVDFEFSWDSVDLVVASSYFERDIRFVFDIRDGVLSATSTLTGGTFDPGSILSDQLEGSPAAFNNVNNTFANEFRFSGNPWPEFFWTAGTYYKTGDDNELLFSEISNPSGEQVPIVDYVKTFDTEVVSLFGQVEYDFTPWLNVAVGTRYFKEHLVTDVEGTVTGNDVTDHVDQKFSATSSKIVASLRGPDDWGGFIDQTLGYITIGEGFRSGGANVSYEGSSAPREYFPDELVNYEIGGKFVFLGGRLSVEAAAYRTVWENIQIEATSGNPNDLSFFENAGTAQSDGFEYNIVANPTSFLTVIHSGTVIDGEYISGDGSKFPGDPIDFVPPKQYSFSTIFNFDWAPRIGGLLRVDYNYQDQSVQQNRERGFNFSSDEIRLLNARLGWRLPEFDFAVFGRNINDVRASQSANIPAYSARTRPRQIGVELNFVF